MSKKLRALENLFPENEPDPKDEIEQIADDELKKAEAAPDPIGGSSLSEYLAKPNFMKSHTQNGLYIRNDLHKILKDKTKGKKGAKTTIVNAALEMLFRAEGWIK